MIPFDDKFMNQLLGCHGVVKPYMGFNLVKLCAHVTDKLVHCLLVLSFGGGFILLAPAVSQLLSPVHKLKGIKRQNN